MGLENVPKNRGLTAFHSFATKTSAMSATSTVTRSETLQLNDVEFDTNYGLLPSEQTVLIRAYSDDTDDQVLSEVRPRYIVMYEPNQDFIRRIEVRSTDTVVVIPH